MARGLGENAGVLEVFLDHHFEQRLSPRRLAPAERFSASTTVRSKI